MLSIIIPEMEFFDDDTQEFIYIKETELIIEYSLLSISRWEARWKKAYINPFEKPTLEETQDLIRCMTVNTKNVDPMIYKVLPDDAIERVNDYINDPMTATEITHVKQRTINKKVTSEEIYYWMVSFGIPFDPCEKWHINRLFALIEICAIKNSGKNNKMSVRESGMSQMELNERRLRELNTEG